MITLIDNYDSFTFNLVQFLGDLGADCVVHRNDKISAGQVMSSGCKAIVLSPGPCTPDEAGICLELVEKAAGRVPILGVCLGHQAIGQAYGGTIVRATPMHGKLSAVTHDGTGVFENIEGQINVTRYHSLTIERETLPECLHVTATTGDGMIMGISHKEHRVHGVQFHPESIASEMGHEMLANFLAIAGFKTNKPPARRTVAA